MTDLPGMWESADFEGGGPDERSYAERDHDRRLDDVRKALLKSLPDFLDEGYDYGYGGELVEYTQVDEEAVVDFVLEKMAEAWDAALQAARGFSVAHCTWNDTLGSWIPEEEPSLDNPYKEYNG